MKTIFTETGKCVGNHFRTQLGTSWTLSKDDLTYLRETRLDK